VNKHTQHLGKCMLGNRNAAKLLITNVAISVAVKATLKARTSNPRRVITTSKTRRPDLIQFPIEQKPLPHFLPHCNSKVTWQFVEPNQFDLGQDILRHL